MPHVRTRPLSRRGLLAAGGAAGLAAFLAACGEDGGSGSSGGGAGGGSWSFTDDRGRTAKADGTPRTVVAFTGTAAALHDYGIECAAVFGPTKTKDGEPDVQAGDLDVDEVEILGNAWGQFSVEKYAALAPELLVAPTFDAAGTLWYVPEESADKILQLAPSVAISVYDRPMTEPLERTLKLAAALGADTWSAEIKAARKRFEDAAGRLRRAAKSRKDIKVLVGSGSADLFYVSGTNLSADLEYFKQLGVNFIDPPREAKKNSGGWFEELSWENADKYDADLIMLDNRTATLQQDALAAKPTWARLPAVEAGQVVPRVTEPVYSYDKCAPVLEDLAEALENARKVS
ncbi:ABC transporter substrate-binding protein [Streptomyces sp. MAR4 CNX-425]|uniref:ABC transporter substrate-binding protein n=1 Tax=Streptomyces sp. MAR4 CNX-425 TaxID=3406343 RepID=UPI003B4FFE80